jgi:hypothetical protein
MHVVFLYIYSTNVYPLLKVEEREFHVYKSEDCSQFVTNASIALKQSRPNFHLTINEKVIS